MQDPNMQKIIEGIVEIGERAIKAGDSESSVAVANASGMIVALCQLNATLEEIRDAIKETSSG